MKKLFFLLPCLALTFASCTNDDLNSDKQDTRLGVKVKVNELSRAGMITGTSLPDDAEIGVSLTATDGTLYNGKTYSNIKYSNGSEWSTETPIMLSGTEGKAIAYFPWKESVQDLTAIPVNVADQEDWMFSGEETGLNDTNSKVAFEMQHAQTAVNIKIIRDDNYTGEGIIESLSIVSNGLASKGSYSAADGTWDAATLEGVGEAIVIADDFQLTSTYKSQENPYMLIPATSEVVPFAIAAMVDGKPYAATVAMTEAFVKGKVYKLNVKIASVGLSVDDVVLIEDWQPESLTDGSFKPAE